MKINMIESGHWEVAPIVYPGKTVKTKHKKRGMSFLVDPNDRESFFGGAFLEDLSSIDTNAEMNKLNSQSDIATRKAQEQARLQKKRILDPSIKKIQHDIKKMGDTLKQKEASASKNALDAKNLHKNVGLLSNELSNLFKIMK